MKKLINKMTLAYLRAQIAAKSALKDERGDTNFISIAIIMIVVIAVAVIFIGFKDELMVKFNEAKDELFGKL